MVPFAQANARSCLKVTRCESELKDRNGRVKNDRLAIKISCLPAGWVAAGQSILLCAVVPWRSRRQSLSCCDLLLVNRLMPGPLGCLAESLAWWVEIVLLSGVGRGCISGLSIIALRKSQRGAQLDCNKAMLSRRITQQLKTWRPLRQVRVRTLRSFLVAP
jgi:hypothetical protein